MANLSFIKSLKISIPSLSVQQEIVNRIENERLSVKGNEFLIGVYDKQSSPLALRIGYPPCHKIQAPGAR